MNDIIISPPREACLSSDISVKPLVGGILDNISAFVKKNAVIIGLGAVGMGAAIYFLTRKKKKTGKGLSGISRKRNRTGKSIAKKAKPKRITAKKLS